MVTKKQKLKLARKYFIEQKKEELLAFITQVGILFIITAGVLYLTTCALGIVGILIHIFPNAGWDDNINSQVASKYGLLYLILNVIVWIGIWLNSNWRRAKRRAGL